MKSLLSLVLVATTCTATIAQTTEIRPIPRRELQTFAAAYSVLQESFVTNIDDVSLMNSALRGLLQGADPEAGEYFTAEEFTKFRDGSGEAYLSTGLELRARNGQFFLAPVEDGPAAQAGVRFGDQLFAVDGVHTRGMKSHQVVELLKGSLGTAATLTVFRESNLSALTMMVERRTFVSPGPKLTLAAPDVAMLKVPGFRGATLRETVALLNSEWRRKPFKALILDLRGSPGGLVDVSIGMAAMFLPAGVLIATMSGNSASSQHAFRATRADYVRGTTTDPLADLASEIRTLPLAVLVDDATTAGAEIAAAALKDHKRATVIGRTTYGKGSIQTITPMPGGAGAIKFTSAYWTSPTGKRIHGAGITPDVTIAAGDPELDVKAALAALQERH